MKVAEASRAPGSGQPGAVAQERALRQRVAVEHQRDPEQIRQEDAKSRVVILVTDGINNRGAIDPLTAAQAAKAVGVKVYTVGVGTRGKAPIPIPADDRGYRRGPVNRLRPNTRIRPVAALRSWCAIPAPN